MPDFFLHLFYFGQKFLYANSVDPEQTPRPVASDLGLHCLPISLLSDGSITRGLFFILTNYSRYSTILLIIHYTPFIPILWAFSLDLTHGRHACIPFLINGIWLHKLHVCKFLRKMFIWWHAMKMSFIEFA